MTSSILTLPNFACPLCNSSLIIGNKVWQCRGENSQQRQHSFDVAKQGYINLLPVQQKKSKQPGDSEASILARQRFLQANFYQSLQDALVQFCQTLLSTKHINSWLDIGCGEGYYTKQFLQLQPDNLIALDISKPAVIATTKRLKQEQHFNTQVFNLVASASHVPLASGSVDVVSSIFSPILPEEFNRLCSEQGSLFIAKPAKNHLLELRQALFEQVVPHDSDKFIDDLAPYFSLLEQQVITNQIKVNKDALNDLLTMTPYSYRAQPHRRQQLIERCIQQGEINITTEFVMYAFQKNLA